MVFFTYSLEFTRHFSLPPRTRERTQAKPQPTRVLYSQVLQFTDTPEPTESHQQAPLACLQLVTRLFFSQMHAGREGRL